MAKEFICMEESVIDTQKKIRTWLSTGYEIDIISQLVVPKINNSEATSVVTSLFRIK